MQNKLFLKAADICELLEVKQTSAYEIIGNLNKELEEQGYLTLRGKVPTKYFVTTVWKIMVDSARKRKGMISCVRENVFISGCAELFDYQFCLLYRVVERMNADLAQELLCDS